MLLETDPEIQKLRRVYKPTLYGDVLWRASWLLIDYLRHQGLPRGVRVMDVGCGWGIAGLYCRKKFNADVVCVDKDADVFPYLELLARVNDVKVSTVTRDIDDITEKELEQVDLLIGADISYLYSLVDSVRRLIYRTLRANVRQIVIADPGRPPFAQLVMAFVGPGKGEMLNWTVSHLHRSEGRILRIGSFD